MNNTVLIYASLVRFAHTVFAMPFALIGFVYALRTTDFHTARPWGWLLVQVVLCMVFARNAAMGFNRWADRHLDARNPRTAGREIPAGVISPARALWFVGINAALFLAVAATINALTAALAPAALAVLLFYSYCKRFTCLAHLVLGLSLGIAPVGAYVAVTGHLAPEPCILALLVMTWCGGFDVIYALQDRDFDRASGLRSIPARFSVAASLRISLLLHAVSIGALLWFAACCPQSVWLWIGVGLFAAILVAEHLLVTPGRQARIPLAFGTLNGLASLMLAFFTILALLR
ncbi:UbiA-like polyprenyltransferase [uncultured Alistipes sp.]|uniref:UbiA-like polyprenyltransferase n=1 Tax=Alistipes sp. TaxID=1872444 RepID=UPI00266D6B8B|nr:UbiA-like polyprenyltransferase [uncultured Alistipes sp.]